MEICLLRLLNLVAERGYFARCDEDRALLQSLEEQNLVQKKRGTQNIYLITDFGKIHLENSLYGREVTLEEFFSIVKNSYADYASPMKPFVKISDLKRAITEKERISENKTEELLLSLHKQGLIMLQTGLQSEVGGVSNPNGGTFAYLMVEV